MLVPRMLQQVPVGERSFMLRRYRRCFTGTDAVAFLLSRKFARSEDEAVAIGNALLRAGVFRHVKGEHFFRPGNYFYRFAAHEDYAAESHDAIALRSSRLMSVATAGPYAARPMERRRLPAVFASGSPMPHKQRGSLASSSPMPHKQHGSLASGSPMPHKQGPPHIVEKRRRGLSTVTRGTMSSDEMTFSSFQDFLVDAEQELEVPEFTETDVIVEIGIRVGRRMFPNLVTKFTTLNNFVHTQRINGKMQKDCFLGKQAVKWLVANKYVNSSVEAIAVGNAMIKAGVFFPLNPEAPGFECNDSAYRMMADVDLTAEMRRGERKDFFLRFFLGIDRAKGRGPAQQQSAPWFEDTMSFSTTSSRGL